MENDAGDVIGGQRIAVTQRFDTRVGKCMIERMEVRHFTHAVGTAPGRAENQPSRQSVSCWDARNFSPRQLSEQIPQLLRELESAATSHFDLMPWLRAILLVSPQSSDALALSVMDHGVVVLEAAREDPTAQVIEAFMYQADQFQVFAMSCARAANQIPSSPSSPGRATDESEFSRTPAYFNQALYSDWIGRLSQSWRNEDAWDSES